uniref:Uncharacterized protein n=1 Tax=Octactis speculum TaxID=3111310 RepID=A0A7S2HKX4_9STRA
MQGSSAIFSPYHRGGGDTTQGQFHANEPIGYGDETFLMTNTTAVESPVQRAYTASYSSGTSYEYDSSFSASSSLGTTDDISLSTKTFPKNHNRASYDPSAQEHNPGSNDQSHCQRALRRGTAQYVMCGFNAKPNELPPKPIE